MTIIIFERCYHRTRGGINPVIFSRRRFLQATGTGLLLAPARQLSSQAPPALSVAPMVKEFPGISRVSLVQGADRRKNVCAALAAIDDQILPKLRQKKYVVIKPNIVNTVNQLASTHADALRGIVDYLAPRFRGPIVIAEASAGDTLEGYENFHYTRLPGEYHDQKITLVDLCRERKFETIPLIDFDLHVTPVRLAARLLDPDAFVICSAIMKTHNAVVATLSVKNLVMGAPLHNPPEEKEWNDKRKYHEGVRQNHYNMLLTAQKLQPNWGATVIDGYEGMEGGYYRFFSYLNLFMFFMLILVLAANFPLLFVGWALARHLLIGFYFLKQSASDAGKKAFIVNRIGGFGFMLGMFLLFRTFQSLDFATVFDGAVKMRPDAMGQFGTLTIASLLLFIGAAGKSAQIPIRLAAGCNGRPHARQRLDPRRDDGYRGRLHGSARSHSLQSCSHSHVRGRDNRLRAAPIALLATASSGRRRRAASYSSMARSNRPLA